MITAFRNKSLAIASPDVRRQVNVLVDPEVTAVVQHPLRRCVVAEYVDPEIDIALQFGRHRERFLRVQRGAQGQDQQQEDGTFSCHLDQFKFQS